MGKKLIMSLSLFMALLMLFSCREGTTAHMYEDIKNDILHALYRAVGLNTPGQGIAFSMPVDAAVGLFEQGAEQSN